MAQMDYKNTFKSNVTAKDAYNAIADVSDWWTRRFKGSAKNLNDTFGVTFGKTRVDFRVIEAIPYSKLVWEVTNCHLDWINNKTEWTGTKIVWNISANTKGANVEMTHVGLVPSIECLKDCEAGWNQYVGESLPRLLAGGKGLIFEESAR